MTVNGDGYWNGFAVVRGRVAPFMLHKAGKTVIHEGERGLSGCVVGKGKRYVDGEFG